MAAGAIEVRVRYAETDQMGVAHHASYLVWFEAGRTELIRASGHSYAQIEKDGWWLVVVEARCRYLRPARYDDVLTIRTRLAALGGATLEFGYQAVRKEDGALLAEGATVHAAVDRMGRPRRIPQEIRRWLGGAGPAGAPPAVRPGVHPFEGRRVMSTGEPKSPAARGGGRGAP
ncbi:MAG: acyl-CoA thioesterase [Bacillati bacterium ANGP1]|uniref:Acyl-CoA thioesterase n=1 Tax=Candidatus Segetimicrobium genomatis TaxID=2569760 RepID=A0A537JX96_9BACT|nr:MAG: acyl-CoA thioesterase [Terrabacteria group bacterium ANGP1]